ncbi:MAG: PEP-CTERM sorting domain-containing protein [Candidatus Accumulibacter phosphatis]|uniref:PEP-CTERM sorting domain-containing protein n=1 Tax=Candidatus Accumulibacter sp. ACC012 TaxID=2823332 RepID=UPI0025C3E9E4|nr:PEP-CTERM sorting domain-containing protein [Candidatus Accumulibacter sp. ACC012]
MKRILQISALTLALVGVGGAQAITLSDLLSGGSITAGDKVFNSFTALSYMSGDGRVANYANIDVTALDDGGMDPGPGLRFTALNGELTVTGNDNYNFIDLAFGFRVTAPVGKLIKDNTLAFAPFGASVFYNGDGANDLGVRIQEWVGDAFVDPTTSGYIYTEFSNLDGTLNSVISASSNFAPQQSVYVTKDILVWAADATDTATLFGFDQRFSQQLNNVPEPGTLALAALGVLGALGIGRRRNRNT